MPVWAPGIAPPIVGRRVVTFYDAGAALLRQALGYWDARAYSGSGDWLNLGTAGAAADLVPGAAAAAPTFLPYAGEQYAYFPGIAGNQASTPDSAATSVTGDLDIIVRANAEDWTPGSAMDVLAKWTDAGNQRSYLLRLAATGALQLYLSSDGTAFANLISTAPTGFANGATGWIRATYRVSDRRCEFFTAPDSPEPPSSWTLLSGDTHSIAAIFNGTSTVTVGRYADGTAVWTGRVYRAMVYNGFSDAGGTLVADYDPSLSVEPHTTFVASTGETWTHNRLASGKKVAVVDRPLFLFGTDDFMAMAADVASMQPGAAGTYTILVAQRSHGTAPATISLFTKRDIGGVTGAPYWALLVNTGATTLRHNTHDGTNQFNLVGGTVRDGFTRATVGVLDGRTATGGKNYSGATHAVSADASTLGDVTNTSPIVLGGQYQPFPTVTGHADFEVMAASYWDRALSEAELTAVCLALGVPA